MKQWIKIIIVFLSILSVAWILFLYFKKPSQNNAVTPSKPNLAQNYKGKLSISLELNKDQFKYVDKLPFLTISRKTLSKGNLATLASYLGFSENPIELNDSQEGLTYFWRKENSTLFAYSKSSKINFTSGNSTNVINKQLSDTAVRGEVTNLLVKSKIFSQDSFTLSNVQYLKEDSLNEGYKLSTDKDFTIFQVNILPKLLNYEILSPTSTQNTNYVRLTKEGDIYSFQIILFENVQNGPTNYKLKNHDEITSSLGNSVLINLQGIETPLASLSSDLIQKITINEISLAYLLESPTSTSLQPVYKLTGVALLTGGSKTIPAVLYLPALSGL